MVQAIPNTRDWRPQQFGRRAARHVEDPVIEPLWSGVRVLAHVSADAVELVDADGGAQDWPDVIRELAGSIDAGAAVLDGYITTEAANEGVGLYGGISVERPTAVDVARQMLWFGGGRNRRQELIDSLEADMARPFAPGEEVVFVAVDLLALDAEPLLDVPLLERKRLLDAVVIEGDRVRRGIHVRPPIDVWINTWRTLGFRSLAYKDANSRYIPGERNDAWATWWIPNR
ncbi:MAG TPA: hypothetical protein VKA85_02980 [Candidatus Limnocylindrales bacterium]|nr:hypothetical protein [Candidatus Limnocylindrales bacterium]